MNLSLLVIGGGKMGHAMVKCVLASGLFTKKQIGIIDPTAKRRSFLTADLGCHIFDIGDKTIPPVDLVIIAVKPHQISSAIKKYLPPPNSLVISIAAGINIKTLSSLIPKSHIVRAMPNTPCIIGQGVSVYYAKNTTTSEEKIIITLLSTMGKVLKVDEEAKINYATSITSSGIGFVYYYALATYKQAIDFGFNEKEADLLVRLNFSGASQMLKHFKDKTMQSLIDDVATAGGTTACGINAFEKEGLADNIAIGLKACLKRTLEIAKQGV